MSVFGILAILVLVLGAGYVAGRDGSRAEVRLWSARCALLLADLARARAVAEGDAAARSRAGDNAWLLDALETVCGELRPGERAEGLAVRARWKHTHDEVLIAAERGGGTPERSVILHVTDGESCWETSEEVDFPVSPESPDWITG